MTASLTLYSSKASKIVRHLSQCDKSMQKTHNNMGATSRAALAEIILKKRPQALNESQIGKLALVIHHGGNARQIRSARSVLVHNYRSGAVGIHTLLHQMTDRICVMKYGRQKFGTQLHIKDGSNPQPFPSITSVAAEKPGAFYHCGRCVSDT